MCCALQTVKCWEISQEDLRRRLMEPGMWTNKALPNNHAVMDRPAGTCNRYSGVWGCLPSFPASATHSPWSGLAFLDSKLLLHLLADNKVSGQFSIRITSLMSLAPNLFGTFDDSLNRIARVVVYWHCTAAQPGLFHSCHMLCPSAGQQHHTVTSKPVIAVTYLQLTLTTD